MANVGKNIRARREELGLTQQELAERMGYKSKSAINKIELGINDITQSKVVAFAKALNTSPAYIMGWITSEQEKMNKAIPEAVNKAMESSGMKEIKEKVEMLTGKTPPLSDVHKKLLDLTKDLSDEEAEQALQMLQVIVQGLRK